MGPLTRRLTCRPTRRPTRRDTLLGLAAWGAAPALSWATGASAPAATFYAAWQSAQAQHLGVWDVRKGRWTVRHALTLPTRAHGLWAEAGGSVLACARRPGDWLLRWHPASGKTQWHWIGDDRRFNGHVIARRDGAALWSSETDLDTAQGWVGVRDVRSLEKTAEWPSHGMDPHALLTLPQAVGDCPAGTLMVANGGIPTLPETGRSKRELARMDASLVALDPHNGALLGQWRLADARLSIRHLAWDPVTRSVGVALQAEHSDSASQQVAPVLAVWDGRSLRPAGADQPGLMGYGGDICAVPGGGFAVSCPRAHVLALFDAEARWRRAWPHPEACALAASAKRWWLASGRSQAGLVHGGADASADAAAAQPTRVVDGPTDTTLLIDNHWALLSA